MAALADYIRHAREYGGLRDVLEAAWDDLDPVELGELAAALRELGKRRRRVGRNGRTVPIERFSLTREEIAALVERLLAAGVRDVDVCRYAGVSRSALGAIRSDRGSDPHRSADLAPVPRRVIRDRIEDSTHRPSLTVEALRSPHSRTCAWCSAPLPSTLRADAHYCIGARCRKAAQRARQAQAEAA